MRLLLALFAAFATLFAVEAQDLCPANTQDTVRHLPALWPRC